MIGSLSHFSVIHHKEAKIPGNTLVEYNKLGASTKDMYVLNSFICLINFLGFFKLFPIYCIEHPFSIQDI